MWDNFPVQFQDIRWVTVIYTAECIKIRRPWSKNTEIQCFFNQLYIKQDSSLRFKHEGKSHPIRLSEHKCVSLSPQLLWSSIGPFYWAPTLADLHQPNVRRVGTSTPSEGLPLIEFQVPGESSRSALKVSLDSLNLVYFLPWMQPFFVTASHSVPVRCFAGSQAYTTKAPR